MQMWLRKEIGELELTESSVDNVGSGCNMPNTGMDRLRYAKLLGNIHKLE